MKSLVFLVAALGLSLTAVAAPGAAAPAPAPAAPKAPTPPQGMGKACNPACSSGTYCVDGQCVDNGVKAPAPAPKGK